MSVYKNGNTIVEIRDDGTKIRYVPDNQQAQPIYPESIDMKISNRCDIEPPCPMCHEQSTKYGALANFYEHKALLDSLHPYTEVAIGGGDPMSHPELEAFLMDLQQKNVIANLTVHWRSFLTHYDTLTMWAKQDLIHGIGVSINEIVPCEVMPKLCSLEHIVVHTVMGVANEPVFRQLADRNLNILLLGYKTFGRGIKYRTERSAKIAENVVWVQKNIKEFTKHFRAVSFDNLAIEQLGLQTKMTPDVYAQMYMGSDGCFTMYIDLVENKYAISSTNKRYNIDKDNVDDLFAEVRKKAGYAT